MKVLVGYSSKNWCAYYTTHGFAPYSKHNVTLQRLKGKLVTRFLEHDDWDNYDVVYLHSSRLILKSINHKWRKNSSTKWMVGIRGFPAYRRYKNGWHLFDGLSVPNHHLKHLIHNHPRNPYKGHIEVCHQGVDPTIFKPMPEYSPEEFTIMWAGNPNRSSKRWDMFLRLKYNKISAGPHHWNEEPVCHKRYDHFTELPTFYNRGSIYIQCSRNDAFSVCPVEAAFTAKPVIGFKGIADRGGNGIEEWVPEEWLVQTKVLRGEGEEKLLIPLIEKLRKDKDLCIEEGKRVRKIVMEKYTNEKVAKEYDRLFESAKH